MNLSNIFKRNGHDSRAIANIFVEIYNNDNKRLSVITLMNMVYISHGWVLGYTGKPLISHKVQHWTGGPAIHEVHMSFGHQRFINQKARIYDPEFGVLPYYESNINNDEIEIIARVYDKYSSLNYFDLKDVTTRNGTPWQRHNDMALYSQIPNKTIENYYKNFIKSN